MADHAEIRPFRVDWDGPLHILVNNAGVMAPPLTRTPQGWELQFATTISVIFALVRPGCAARSPQQQPRGWLW